MRKGCYEQARVVGAQCAHASLEAPQPVYSAIESGPLLALEQLAYRLTILSAALAEVGPISVLPQG